MKLISILLVGILAVVSCAQKPLPRQEYANMPTQVVDEQEAAQKIQQHRAGLSSAQKAALIAGAAIIAYYGYKALSGRQSGCGNCSADGVVNRGDRGYNVIVVRKAHICPSCNGYGVR